MTRTLVRIAVVGVFAGLGMSAATGTATAKPKKLVKPRKTFRLIKKPHTKTRFVNKNKKPPPKDPGSSGPECWIKTSDIIDKRIDIGAQYSLMRRMAGDKRQRREGSSMLQAIKSGKLAAILLPPRKMVSDRGRRMSPQKGYWQLIPKGQNSVCLKEPAGEAPMIVYRENLSKPQIDAALSSAWAQCRLPLLPKACGYEVDLVKPADKPVECKVDADCVKKQLGNVCNDKNTCEVHFPGGDKIGPGKKKTGQKAKCYDQAHATWRSKKTACEDAEFPKLAKCTLENLVKPSPAKLAKCLYDAYSQKESCKRKAFNEYEHKRKHVCPKKPD